MTTGFMSFKQDGNVLYDTSKISYGLLKSGYLSLQTSWPRLRFRSIQLDPNDPASWEEGNDLEPVLGFSVSGAVAPIVFIAGSGSPCGSSTSGGVTTFYFISANTSTKYYYFDTMRDAGPITGMKCYREDGVLTFNSSQRPLNIVGTVSPPPPADIWIPGTSYRPMPYKGGLKSNGSVYPGGPNTLIVRVTVPFGVAEEYAAYVNFTRSIGNGPQDSMTAYLAAMQEGAYGLVGSIGFMFCTAARTTLLPQQRAPTQSYNGFFDIPTDRYPSALVIRTSEYPFPFN